MHEPPPQGDHRSDAELIDAVRSGDPDAFGFLYKRHYAAIRAMARYYARDHFTADDLVSQACENILIVLRAGGGPDIAFRAYAYATVRRLAYDQTKHSRKNRATDDFSAFENPGQDLDPVIGSLERTLVSDAFSTLPERWQAVLWYIEVEGMSAYEVAPLLGLTPSGVAALTYRAREGLREAYLQSHVVTSPSKSSCETFRGRLGVYVGGGLPALQEKKLKKHLESCDECAAIVVELRDASHGMRAIIGPLVLGGSAMAGLGWGITSGTPSASAAVVALAPRRAARAARATRASGVATASAAIAAAALIAAVIVFSGSPNDEALQASPATAPAVVIPTVSATPAASATPTSTSTATPPPPATAAPAPDTPTPIVADPPAPALPVPAPALNLSMADVGDLVLGRDGMLGVVLSNSGNAAATAVTITMSFPAGVRIDPTRTVTLSGAAGFSCAAVTSGFTCVSPLLAAGANVAVYVPVVVSASADTVQVPGATVSAGGQATQSVSAAQPVVAEGLGTRFIVDGSYAATSSGASFVSCDTSNPACLLAQDRDPSVPLNNNDWQMVAVDGTGTGSVSSQTQVSLPAGAQVVFAGLYWSASVPAGDTDSTLANLQLIAPDGATSSVTASRVDRGAVGSNEAYQSFADVTNLVAAGGAGSWGTSGARIGPGAAAVPGGSVGFGVYGGWSLVVVYSDASLSSGRVTVFDGFANVTRKSVSFVVAGIPNSTMTANVVAWEGDAATNCDSLKLGSMLLTRATGGADSNNVFDSTANGSATLNSFGVDVGAFLPVPLSQSRAVVTATTSGDFYTIGAVLVTTR